MFGLATKRYVRRQVALMCGRLLEEIDDLRLECAADLAEAMDEIPADVPDYAPAD